MQQDFPSQLRLRQALAVASLGVAALAHAGDRPPADHDAFREAITACAAEQGLPPPGERREPKDGQRPDHAKLDKCMSAKGFKPPAGGGRPRPHEDDIDEEEEW
ncbi:hypothetical protein ACFW0P_18190 [Lysobacter soli]|uniref:hypothetical protein n=1 Tax=Lysobacter soli TaxID=453783 RepID=UPI0036AC3243